MSGTHILPAVALCLWSDDIAALDLERDKAHIIKQVLDHGSMHASDWLRSTYPAADIRVVIENTPTSAWGKKSLALWSLVYGVFPQKERRFASA
jgi:hypothetical protein